MSRLATLKPTLDHRPLRGNRRSGAPRPGATASSQAPGRGGQSPGQARDFARATGHLAKYLTSRMLTSWPSSPNESAPGASGSRRGNPGTHAWMVRRRQVVDMITAEKNRLAAAPPSKRVVRAIRKTIACLEKQLDEIDSDINGAVRNSPAWKSQRRFAPGVPGVGKVLSRTLLAHAPEIGTLTRKHEVAPLIGLAPLNCDSGTYRGRRRIWGGRARVRSCSVHGHAICHPLQPGHRGLPRTPYRRWQAPKGRHRRLLHDNFSPSSTPCSGRTRPGEQRFPLDQEHRCSPCRGEGWVRGRAAEFHRAGT